MYDIVVDICKHEYLHTYMDINQPEGRDMKACIFCVQQMGPNFATMWGQDSLSNADLEAEIKPERFSG